MSWYKDEASNRVVAFNVRGEQYELILRPDQDTVVRGLTAEPHGEIPFMMPDGEIHRMVAPILFSTVQDTMFRALEIIAVGDSEDPVATATKALIEAGLWLPADCIVRK